MIKKINAAVFLSLCVLLAFSGITAEAQPSAIALPNTVGEAARPSDISGHWAKKQIEDWLSQKLASGYPDGTFHPDDMITRAEFMALANKAFGFTSEAPVDFKDVKSTDWFAKEVAKAKAAGYVSGDGAGAVRPNDNITREEAAAMLGRICKLKTPDNVDEKLAGFIDAGRIQWSKAAVASVVAMGYMTGYPDDTFQPLKPITRAEAICTLDRAKAGAANASSGTTGQPAGISPALSAAATSWSADTSPPSFSTYPEISEFTSTTADLLVRINENGIAYFVVLDCGSAAPTAYQVRAGQDSAGRAVPSYCWGSIALRGGCEETITISGLEASKDYDIYVVAEDAIPNLQPSPAVVKLTRDAPVFVSAETSADGSEVRVAFDKRMDYTSSKYKKQFKVLVDGVSDPVTDTDLDGSDRRVIVLELEDEVLYGQNVTVAYTEGSVVAYDGGELLTFEAKTVTNFVVKPPNAPSGLTASPGNGEVTLEWDEVAGAEGYIVYQSVNSGGPYTQVSSKRSSAKYTASGLLNGVTYYFVVQAYNDGGESADSSQIAAVPVALPNAPAGLTASAGNGQINLSWNAVAGAIGYKVYRADSSGGPYAQVWGGKETSCRSDGLTNGKTYYFYVRAVNISGDSNSSNTVSAAATDNPSPTGLTASAGNGCVTLDWDAVAGATGYKVYKKSSSGLYTQIGVVAGGTTLSYTAAGLTNGTKYYFVVRAANNAGNSANSNEVSAAPRN
ncbi:MAG: Cellulosome-anchoring protein precursor [Pelotomaculum sp. PtaU1.Bin035]|nr:MAG: Cellulosome-anchoring protein precursor [Pelotomaculum sp. PtaU1.Bin035]